MRVAIVDDEASFAQTLAHFCSSYQKECGEEIAVTIYDNPIDFLEKYKADADVIFMDILMPQMNGMECARRLRQQDENVILCFVTSMAKYAVQGYEVGAIDFIIKPVNYDEFFMKMSRIVRIFRRQASAAILVSSRNEVRRIDLRDLVYVEVYNHSLIYHTTDGDIEVYGKLSALEEDERFRNFIRCSASYLVNCSMISSVQLDAVTVRGVQLPISRRRRKECLEKIAAILGGVCH